jgi:phosphoglycolate phosphatase
MRDGRCSGYRSCVRRAVLFDLDGTLVDSLPDIAVALERALADHDLPAPPAELVRTWIGGGARMLIAHAVTGTPALVDPLLARFRVHYAAAPVVRTTLYDGVAPVLDALVGAGVALAVLTNKPHELAVPICERLLGAWPFAAVIGHRPGEPLKPDPTMARALAERMVVRPEHCALVGDAATDIATARAAGMRAVGVAWGYRPRDELVAAGADWVAATPSELMPLAAAT